MGPLEWLELLVGITIIAFVMYDVFSAVVVPRAVSPVGRLSATFVRSTWRVWRAVSLRIPDDERREDMLGRYAPAALVSLLLTWLTVLIVGYGFVFHALHDQLRPHVTTFLDALYTAGTLLTIGLSDFAPTGTEARFLAIAAGATGLALFAIIIAFIFSIFGSFQNREVFVVMMGSRMGAPPSGVTLLETTARWKLDSDLGQGFRDAEKWAAAVLESHLAYPILAYFRSSHDDESWIGTLGALLDASTMLITLTDSPLVGQAKLFHTLGVHLTRDLSRYFHITGMEGVGIERSEFNDACAQLAAAGVAVQNDDAAWQRFSELRTRYAGPLNEMAHFWLIPPTRWIGDRSAIGPRALHALKANAPAS